MQNPIKRMLKYYGEARQRAGRRRSPWNAFLLLLSMATWFGTVYMLFRLVWLFHTTLYPEHQLSDFGRAGSSFHNGGLSLLMIVSLVPGSGATAFIIVNSLFWLFPWPRKVFEDEAKNHPGTDFRNAIRKLFKMWIWTFPTGLAISLLAAYLLKSLR